MRHVELKQIAQFGSVSGFVCRAEIFLSVCCNIATELHAIAMKDLKERLARSATWLDPSLT